MPVGKSSLICAYPSVQLVICLITRVSLPSSPVLILSEGGRTSCLQLSMFEAQEENISLLSDTLKLGIDGVLELMSAGGKPRVVRWPGAPHIMYGLWVPIPAPK